MSYNSLIISLKEGRLLGSLSQHLLINLDQGYGVLLGILGLNYLFSTSSDTLVPLILR